MKYIYQDKSQLEKIFKKRKADTNKSDYGRLGILGGSSGMLGSVHLASMAGLRAGSGLVYSLVGKSLAQLASIKALENIVVPIEDREGELGLESLDDILSFIPKLDCLALGFGMATSPEKSLLIHEIIKNIQVPLLIDADGLNNLKLDNLKDKNAPIVLTPHPGEMSRLTGLSIDQIQADRENIASSFAKKHQVILVLKGHKTLVSSEEGHIYINTNGNPGMATAGSGDVLGGIIASYMGQAYSPLDSAILGVYHHGKAGDKARDRLGENYLLARDIIEGLAGL